MSGAASGGGLNRGRGHDHAVPALGERQLRPAPLIQRQRRM